MRPLAHRLGDEHDQVGAGGPVLQSPLPRGVYEEIEHMVAERAPAREEYLRQVRLQIEEDLRVNKIKGVVTGRPKHYYSIYQKMIVRGKEFDDIYDLVAVRIIVDTIQDCYAVLGSLHSRWTPMSGRFKDYIAVPKFTSTNPCTLLSSARAGNRWRFRSAPMRCTAWRSTG